MELTPDHTTHPSSANGAASYQMGQFIPASVGAPQVIVSKGHKG
jgi:hypothetical protein